MSVSVPSRQGVLAASLLSRSYDDSSGAPIRGAALTLRSAAGDPIRRGGTMKEFMKNVLIVAGTAVLGDLIG